MKVLSKQNDKGFDVEHQIEMLSDGDRVNAIEIELKQHSKVDLLEIGYGSGYFLNKFRESYNRVVGIDVDNSFIKKIHEKIITIHGDYLNEDLLPGDLFDVILSETCSTWGIEEDHVNIMAKVVKTHLVTGGTLIPQAQVNFIECGYINIKSVLSDRRYLEFTRILSKFKPLTSREIFSVYDLDFYKEMSGQKFEGEVAILNPSRATINSIRLTTTQIFGKDNYIEPRDSINAPIIIPIPETSERSIKIKISFDFSSSIDDINVAIG